MSNIAELNESRVQKVNQLAKAKEAHDAIVKLKKSKGFIELMERFKGASDEAIKGLTDPNVSKEECLNTLTAFSVFQHILDSYEYDLVQFQNVVNQHDAYVQSLTEFEG